ncbi:sensor histidine kinase [Sphingomonas lenta]|uniref:histidine kinase n=1 Tax=Sphingomonas lenta TaxID=1141887 RepID=A0A2A2SJB7_9SPHN|nr:HAMP domain-containing sensor histidine kinase [Sphingomonas lenta]PAX09332.1 PAS domain-containing sensor histidine kinase [Sphingomonas lenta]
MTAEIAHGLVDADGRLAEAEDALLGLVMRAGGGLGRPVAVPQLATLARLARRLQVPIARSVTVADRDADIELFVRAQPEAEGVRLSVAGWRERQAWRPKGEDAEADLLDTAADWRWESDAALRLRFASIEAGLRYGFDAVGLLGKPVTELFTFEPDTAGQLPIIDALANRRSFSGQPAKLRPSGRPVLVSALARRDAQGAFAGFAGGVVLVERPQPEGVAASIGDRLERALRTPLGRIIANADSIQAGADGPLAPDYAAYAADIASAGRHLLGLVDDLADLEAVERPDFQPELEPIDLADLARRAAGLLSVRAANAGVTIARPEADMSVPAIGDFRRVLQILVNLIGNAVRYSPQGSTVDAVVHPDASVTVTDTGKGIAPDDQARIFEKFERVDPSEPGGSGLGLYIARRLARAMGGDLTVESAPGEGARFTLQLRPPL